MKTLQEIIARRAAIKADIEARSAELTDEQIDAYEKEIADLDAAEKSIKKREAIKAQVSGFKSTVVEVENKTGTSSSSELRAQRTKVLNERGAQYKAKSGKEVDIMERALSVEDTSDNGVIIPKHYSRDVDRLPFNEASGIIDLVNYIALPNGNEYTKAFQITTGEGDYTLEATKTGDATEDKDGVYHKVETTFDKVTIKRNKITALDYMSEEMEDLPDADYASAVEDNIVISLRKKVAKEIVLGDGTGNHFVGLLCPKGANINANTYTDKLLATIDENTLTDVQIDFGGSEDIESRMGILMNKQTIKEFIKVRGANKLPVYNVQFHGNTATIDGVNVVFSSHIKPFASVGKGEFYMVYGDYNKYLALDFGGTTAEASKDFKFDQGLIALRGKTYGGGAPAGYKAFNRYYKEEASL